MNRAKKIEYAIHAGIDYFTESTREILVKLPIMETTGDCQREFSKVELPAWADGLGVAPNNYIIVPSHCLPSPTDESSWMECDWWEAIYSLIACEAEKEFEAQNGCIHSYAFRLPKNYLEAYEHAWVNRIFLFLRRWASVSMNVPEKELFGPLPPTKLVLSHDIDAIQKTTALKLKKSLFDLFKVAKLVSRGRLIESWRNIRKIIRFAMLDKQYDFISFICRLESKFNRESIFFVYAGETLSPIVSIKRWLLDPRYNISCPENKNLIKKLKNCCKEVGLHQAFDSWKRKTDMSREKSKLELALSRSVTSCRQHWLRFSWQCTWQEQLNSGFNIDYTLGFNDRPAFRNSAALKLNVAQLMANSPNVSFFSIPLLLMDSHIFDYKNLSTAERRKEIDKWLEELFFVRGTASVNWHHRVFDNEDYSWGLEYEYLLLKAEELGNLEIEFEA